MFDGFLAHEVQEIVPYAINGKKDAVDENGNIEAQSIDKGRPIRPLYKNHTRIRSNNTALDKYPKG